MTKADWDLLPAVPASRSQDAEVDRGANVLRHIHANPIHSADRAVIDAFVKQRRIYLARRMVLETRIIEHRTHDILFRLAQRSGWGWPRLFLGLRTRLMGTIQAAARKPQCFTSAPDRHLFGDPSVAWIMIARPCWWSTFSLKPAQVFFGLQ